MWAAVLQSARDAIVAIDGDGRIAIFNPAAQAMFDYAEAEVLGRNVALLMPDPYATEHDAYIDAYKRTGVRKAIGQIRYVEARRRDGTVFPIELSVAEATVGKRLLYTAVVRDVTERRALEATIARERDFAELLIDTAQVIVLVVDPEGRVVRMNSFMEDLTGFQVDEITGANWLTTFVAKRDRARMAQLFVRAIAGASIRGSVNTLVTRDGSEREIDWSARRLHDREGALLGVLWSGQDVTDQKQAEVEVQNRVRQQAALTRLGLRALSDPDLVALMNEGVRVASGTLRADLACVYSLVAATAGGHEFEIQAAVGWQPGTVGLRRSANDPTSHPAATLAACRPLRLDDVGPPGVGGLDLLARHEIRSGVAVVISAPEKPVGVLAIYTTDERQFSPNDVNFLQSVANIIAEAVARSDAERAVIEARRIASERGRLADIGAISARMVHDLGNPLAALSMQAQLILRRARRGDFQPVEPVIQPAEQLIATLHRLESLIHELNDFVREQRLILTTFSVQPFLETIAALWRPLAAARSIGLWVADTDPKLELRGDPDKLRRVFDNLVKNAIDAIGGGPGDVRMSASLDNDKMVRLCIDDTGSGVPEGLDVFRLFETTKPDGTGIGLAVARQIAQAHGGTITHGPATPRGARFVVELPQGGPIFDRSTMTLGT